MPRETNQIEFSAIKIKQPIGDFFIGAIDAKDLCDITYSDIRGIEKGDREIAKYIGINRHLSMSRVKELQQYVNTYDATFPTSVILAVDGRCSKWDAGRGKIVLKEYIDRDDPSRNISFDKIAKILDGQHRLAGLEGLTSSNGFQINVTVFIDIDIAEQANIFSIVNLAQTKVNKSLVYDLYDYAKARSPQKTGHSIAVVLNQKAESPFYKKIKRLGVATEGVFSETITQATFVQALLVYITKNEMIDRDVLLRGGKLALADEGELKLRIFRNLFVEEKDDEIIKIIWTYFEVIKEKWPTAWNSDESQGLMLNRTNGFRAFMRFLRPLYLDIKGRGERFTKRAVLDILNKTNLTDVDFNTTTYLPGTSGESALFNKLKEDTNLTQSS